MTWDEVRAVAREWPDVEDGSYHGYPALRVNGKFLTRLGDDHASLEFKAVNRDERDMLIESAPALFFMPENFHGRGVFARLSKLNERTLRALLEKHWRNVAPKALVKAYDAHKT